MTKSTLFRAALIGCFVGSSLWPYPVTLHSLETLAKAADAVVVGNLVQGVQTGTGITGALEVRRSLKGTLTPGSMVPVTWQASGLTSPSNRSSFQIPTTEGMWFLKDSGGYSLLPLASPATDPPDLVAPVSVEPLLPSYEPTPAASLMDRIILELASSVQRGRRYGMGDMAFRLGLDYESAGMEPYARMLGSDNLTLRACGLTVLLRRGNVALLAKYESLLAQVAERDSPAGPLLTGALEETRTQDPSALAVLGRAALSPDPKMSRLARSSARAIAAIHSPDTLPTLRAMLDSANPDVRSAGVNGLSSYVMNLPVRSPQSVTTMAWMKPSGPSPLLTDEVRQHIQLGPIQKAREEATVSFWRGWWSEKEASLPIPRR